MKLELKHLAPYLPYGISYNYTNFDRVSVLTSDVIARREKLRTIDKIRPILRPLSDLTNEIEHNNKRFVPVETFEIGDDDSGFHVDFGNGNVRLIKDLEFCAKHNDHHDIKYVPAMVFNQLIEWHFDVFGLIGKGLAIDKNSFS